MTVTFTIAFWNALFRIQGVAFNYISAYHPQTDGQMEVVNRVIEKYLRCFTNEKYSSWAKWLGWAEFCYNSSYQSAIRMSPRTLLTYVPGTTESIKVDLNLRTRDQLLIELQENL